MSLRFSQLANLASGALAKGMKLLMLDPTDTTMSSAGTNKVLDFADLRHAVASWYDVRDYADLSSADAAAVVVNGDLFVPPGTWVVPASISLHNVRLGKGAMLQPAAGVNITISGDLTAPHTQIFDYSKGGTISFAGNRYLPRTEAMWWGVQGNDDGNGAGTDDTSAWQHAINGTPDGMELHAYAHTRSKITNSLIVQNRQSLALVASSRNRYGNDNTVSAQFNWYGAAGGIMIDVQYSRFCRFDSFAFQPRGLANTGVNLDGISGGQIGTACEVNNCYFYNPYSNPFVCVYVSKTVSSNQEYHRITNCYAALCPNLVKVSGSTTVAANSTAFSSTGFSTQPLTNADVGRRVRAICDDGTTLNTTIATVTSGTAGTLTVAPTVAITGKQLVVGGAGDAVLPLAGTLVHIGPSANAKSIYVGHCTLSCGAYGIYAEGGSFTSDHNSWTGLETNLYVGSASEPCVSLKDNTEFSLHHAYLAGGQSSFSFRDCRFAPAATDPLSGYIYVGTDIHALMIEGCMFDQPVPAGCRTLDLRNAANALTTFEGNRCYPTTTTVQLGTDPSVTNGLYRAVRLGPNFGLDYGTTGIGVQLVAAPFTQIGNDPGGNPVHNQLAGDLAVGANSTGISWWTGSSTVTPGSIAAGAQYTFVVNMNGFAQLTDSNQALVGFNCDLGGCLAHAQQTGFHLVTVTIYNPTAAAININGGAAVTAKVTLFHF